LVGKLKDMATLQKEVLTVEYDPELDVYFIPSKSMGSKVAKYEVFQSRRTDLWVCNCKRFCISLNYVGECRHIKVARFYKQNEYNKKYMMIRNRD
jgi:hypothetical protein